MSGRRCRNRRLETPLREFTSEDTETFGGYSSSRWTWSSSPSISRSVAWNSRQTSVKISRSASMAAPSNTRRRYLATKTKCTCILKTQCLPCRIPLSCSIGQCYHVAMERLQAYKFELCPDGAQRRLMRRFAGSCRYVYNRALALQRERYERGEKKLGYAGLCKELTAWRNHPGTGWLADAHSQALQQALKDLEQAYANFFAKRARFPRFKKKGLSWRGDTALQPAEILRLPEGRRPRNPPKRICMRAFIQRRRNRPPAGGRGCQRVVDSIDRDAYANIDVAKLSIRPQLLDRAICDSTLRPKLHRQCLRKRRTRAQIERHDTALAPRVL